MSRCSNEHFFNHSQMYSLINCTILPFMPSQVLQRCAAADLRETKAVEVDHGHTVRDLSPNKAEETIKYCVLPLMFIGLFEE